jgi:hypothetical protein
MVRSPLVLIAAVVTSYHSRVVQMAMHHLNTVSRFPAYLQDPLAVMIV